jgi:indolepyruvate ferredoxin oxidoreductase alpha subunit
MGKILLSGNEAIALGAYEAGVTVGTGYPGTPSTEILENLTAYQGVYTEWSVNEKVALEVATGSSLTGARTLVTMKHVGLNVAADPLFTACYTGIKGGMVIANADDPNMHSSQNEQDNRNYARAAKVPMLEPADSQEAKDFTVLAYSISEKYDTPVILRITTRIAHSKTVVNSKPHTRQKHNITGFKRDVKKYVMIPAFARLRHIEVEKRMAVLRQDVNKMQINRIEMNDPVLGIITSGICYNYVKEADATVSILKLGIVYPLPQKLIQDFFNSVKKVLIVEELDPFLETEIKAMGFTVQGKEYFPLTGELNPDMIKSAIQKIRNTKAQSDGKPLKTTLKLPPRPPSLCPGCPHRAFYKIIKELGLIATGDIGCYTLGVLPPYNALDTCIEMGGSIGHAQGIEIAEGKKYKNNAVAVIGDSTFAHSGITGLLNAAYNRRHSLIIVLDNGTTAMTGMQPNPLSGQTIDGQKATVLDYIKLGQAVGIDEDNIKIVDAYKPKQIKQAITTLLDSQKLSLLVIKGLCIILKRKKKK